MKKFLTFNRVAMAALVTALIASAVINSGCRTKTKYRPVPVYRGR